MCIDHVVIMFDSLVYVITVLTEFAPTTQNKHFSRNYICGVDHLRRKLSLLWCLDYIALFFDIWCKNW